MITPIQPDTRLATLLAEHPELETRLLAAIPALASVRNETLRHSLLQGTTLEQAARLTGLPAGEFVAVVRAWAGQAQEEEASCGPGGHVPLPPTPRPAWAREFIVRFRVDADEMLATGLHPAGTVRQCASALQPGEMVVLVSSFCPSPLIHGMRHAGFEAWTGETAPGRWESCFRRRQDAANATGS
ncbi:MAG: DUF1858 domain-containing protein [Bryobacteraceae bacterium]|nr:DUF1858 domain-containing protein [Bryobacteraceae bacterium]